MSRRSMTATVLASLLMSVIGAGSAFAQYVLPPGSDMSGELSRSSSLYPNSQDVWNPNGLRHECFALDTAPGSHWEIEVTMRGGANLAIGKGLTCANAREHGWLFTQQEYKGALLQKTTAHITAGGGRYMIGVTSRYFGKFKIRAVETSGGDDYVALLPGRRPDRDPPAGSASTVKDTPGTTLSPGQTFRDCETCPEMVVLPAGSFMMGSNEFEEGRESLEGPQHRVTIARPFAIGRLEVTFDEYEACVSDGGCDPVNDNGWGRGRRPVINVAYYHAKRYVTWLSETTGQKYFIPSEAEWEYAARAGTDTPWNTGTAIISADANFLTTFGKTVPTGSYPPNAFGLYDMHGNVWEWTQDCLDTGYLGVPNDGAAATAGDCFNKHIIRGGGHDSPHAQVRSAARGIIHQNLLNGTIGFRVTRAL